VYPSDEFGKQELPEPQVSGFVEGKGLPVDAPGFHLMAKVNTNGPQEDAVWTYAKSVFPGPVKWNFDGIFLFDKKGTCVARKTFRGDQPTVDDLRVLL